MAEEETKQNTTERIGKVCLDLSQYSGQDLYSDGETEDQILDIVKTHPEADFDGIIRESKSWPVLYHLSSIRGNIVSWIPFRGDEKVLEIGAGEGAVTGALAARCGHVDCIDLSKKRSEINAWRHRDCDNITIHVGNFEDIEPGLDRDYDYIFLIGVLEYAESYLHSMDPFADELKRVLRHRKEGGRLVIAIENRLGLKYWAGCAEDHSGRYFDGIESYTAEKEPARTFTRPALERLLQRSGAAQYSFYYPYPDYKFTSVLYSDRRLPEAQELNENIRNFDRDRLLLFDERRAYRGITDDGLYSIFANSYEVVVGPALPVIYCKFSNDRAPEYRIRTEIQVDLSQLNGERTVRKYPMTEAAKNHTDRMEENGKLLAERYESTAGDKPVLRIARCRKTEDGGVEFPFVPGKSLEALLDESLGFGDGNRFLSLLDTYKKLVGGGTDAPVSDYDMTFANILIQGNVWTAIDYEWAVDQRIPAEELLFRSLLVYYLADGKRSKRCESLIGNDTLLARIGVPEQEANRLAAEEQNFQNRITGGVVSLGGLRAEMGTKVIRPAQLQTKEEMAEARNRRQKSGKKRRSQDFTLTTVQVFFDTGKGYSPEDCIDVPEVYQDEGVITFPVKIESDVRKLRVDPASCPCVCLLRGARVNGQDAGRFFDRTMKMNGRKYTNGSIIYTTDDPNMEWNLKRIRSHCGIKAGEAFELELSIQMAGLPSTMAAALRNR